MIVRPAFGATFVRRPIVFAAGAVVALGALRGGIQVAAQQRYAQAPYILLTLIAATTFWLPVPLFVAWCYRQVTAVPWRWLAFSLGAVAVVCLEPVWFLTVLRTARLWNPTAGFLVNGVLRSDTNLLIYAAIIGTYWLADTNRRQAQAAVASLELRRQATDAELEILTMQLHPHFLFNTLNLVSQLAYESAARARSAIDNLRRLLRESMSPQGRGTTSLAHELELLEAYLDIQRERFGSKLDARVSVDVDVLAARVPRLLLQPIVENAIRHGISKMRRGGVLRVNIVRRPYDTIRVIVSDDGAGLSEPRREGVGLTNVRHRLQHLFGGRAKLQLLPRDDGGAMTVVDLPFESIDERDADRPPSHAFEITLAEDALDSTFDDRSGRFGVGIKLALTLLGWAGVAGVWTEVEAVVPRAMNLPVPWAEILLRNAIIASAWVCLTPTIVWLTHRLATVRVRARLLGHIASAAALTAGHLAVTAALLAATGETPVAIRNVRVSWAVWDLVAYVFLATAVTALAARRALHREASTVLAENARLSAARLALMRLQIQPELMLAGLAAIEATVDDAERCEATTTRFGDILRSLLMLAGREVAVLSDELALLRSYLDVIGGELTAEGISASHRDVHVPAVLLQPVAAAIGARRVRVRTMRFDERIVIELAATETMDMNAQLLGIVERRLDQLFGDRAFLRLVRDEAVIVVHIELPAEPQLEAVAPLHLATA